MSIRDSITLLRIAALFCLGIAAVSILFNIPGKADALSCGTGTVIGRQCRVFLTTAGASTWTVPSNWNSLDNTIEVIGGGGRGDNNACGTPAAPGGGGGAYSSQTNVSLPGGGSVGYTVGAGGNIGTPSGGASFICNSTSNCATIGGSAVKVGANGGSSGVSGGAGGSITGAVGTTKRAGGNGGVGDDCGGDGGGGAAGPNGAGANGGSSSDNGGAGGGGNGGGFAGGNVPDLSEVGANGGNNSLGAGGGLGGAIGVDGQNGSNGGGGGGGGLGNAGGDGGAGVEWTTAGSGGGGGGSGGNSLDGRTGGLYGGGGSASATGGLGGNGAQGIIVITYTPKQFLARPPNNLGLVGYWSFNEGTTTVATDFSGNGHPGTLSGSPPATWVNGKLGAALSFDGTDDHVSTGNVGSVQTVSFWMKADDITSRSVIDMGGSVRIELNGSSQVTATNFSGATIYVDGSSASSVVDTGWHFITITSSAVTASAVDIGLANSVFFDGTIDEVRMYSRALSAAEVGALYTSGAVRLGASTADLQAGSSLEKGLVALWTFDGKDVTDKIYDRSGLGNNGYILNNSTSSVTTIGILGQALQLDGTNDSVPTQNITSTNNAPQMSISMWVKTDTYGADMVFAAKNDSSFVWWFGTESNCGAVGDDIEFATGSGWACTNNHPHQNNVWEHWVVVLNSAGGSNAECIKIYENGVENTSMTYSTPCTSTGPGTFPVTLGQNPPGGGAFDGYFDGSMDDVRIYNRVLTAAEAKRLYNLGKATVKP